MSGWQITNSKVVPPLTDRFAHILLAIDTIQAEMRGASTDSLGDDRMKRLALERLFEIISVASDHVPESLKAAENAVDWQAIADIGERLENTRERIETNVLWTMSQCKLPPLKTCAERHL